MIKLVLLLLLNANVFSARLELFDRKAIHGTAFVKDGLVTVRSVKGYYQYNYSLVKSLQAAKNEWLAVGTLVELRQEPELTADVLLSLREGCSVRQLKSEARDGFLRVRVYDKEGWILEKQLTKRLFYDKLPNPRIEFSTQKGVFILELYEDEAPNTTANFVNLVEKQFYDGLKIFRHDEDFLLQLGDPSGTGEGGPGYRIASEINVLLKNMRGAVGMADAGLNTAGSQFYLLLSNAPHLDGRYTVFGHVLEGMEVIDLLTVDDVILNTRILAKRDHPYIPQTLEQD